MSQLALSDGQARFLHLKSIRVEEAKREAKFIVVLKHRADFKEAFKSEKKTRQVTLECNTYVEVTTTAELAVQSSHAKFDFRLDLSAAHKEQTHVDPASGITVTVSFGECVTGSEVAHRRLEYAMSALQKHESIMGKLETGTQHLEFFMNIGVGMSELNPVAKAVMAVSNEMFKRIKDIPEIYQEYCIVIQDMLSVLPTTDEAWKNFSSADAHRVLRKFINVVIEASQEVVAYYKQSKKVFWSRNTLSSKKGNVEKLKNAILRGESGMTLAFLTEIQDGVSHNLREIEDVKAELRLLCLQVSSDEDRNLLKQLMPPDNSSYDPDHCCLHGTRMTTLEKLNLWAHDYNSSSRLYWVYGVAGCGKSSIASSISERLDSDTLLAGCFFCKRDIPERKDPVRLIWSLARYIAYANKHFGDSLLDSLKGAHALVNTRSLSSQFSQVIEKPLARVQNSTIPVPLILVVDALDECDDNGKVSKFLAKMVELAPWLRIIVTSRYIADVRDGFSNLKELKDELDLFQQNAHEDILAYLYHQFSRDGMLKVLSSYVKEHQIEALADRARGLFIWIDTVLKYVSSWRGRKHRLIEEILASEKALKAEEALDALYRHVLNAAAGSSADGKEIVRLLIGTIFASSKRRPLPANTLHNFMPPDLDLLPSELMNVLEDLSPVLIKDESSEGVRAYHPSFLDFIENQTRSADYWTEGAELEAIMAKACFRIMECGSRCDESQQKVSNEGLRFDICRLETSYRVNREVTDLKERVSANICPELQYSSIYWYSHLEKSNLDNEIRGMLGGLLGTSRALYWLEAMSLMGELSLAQDILKRLRDEDKPVLDDGEIRNVISELNHFVETFYKLIEQYTPHIYTSAIAWMPSGSILRKRWSPQFPRLQKVSIHDKDWPDEYSESMTYGVSDVAYSPDGTRIVSNSHNHTLRIRDAQSGAPVGEALKGHTSVVSCVAYSPDGAHIISGSYDCKLRMWDGQSGARVGKPLKGHTDYVICVAYSRDGLRIVSGSADGTLRMWDGKSGAPVGKPLRGHMGFVNCVAYSPDGTRIVSSSWNHTLRMWDGQSGAPLGESLKGHTSWVTCVVYSPDGTHVVSGSEDCTLRMWDGQTGAAVGEPLTGHTDRVTCVAYSPDGTRIISGSMDHTLRMWDGKSGAPIVKTFKCHTSWVKCVVYSPDGTRVVSGAYGGTLRMWDAQSGAPVTDSPWGESRWDSDRQCFVSTSESTALEAAENLPLAHPPVPLCVPDDGWIRTLDDGLLLWIPREYRNDICDLACMPENADGHLLGIDWKNIYHGENWTKIYRE